MRVSLYFSNIVETIGIISGLLKYGLSVPFLIFLHIILNPELSDIGLTVRAPKNIFLNSLTLGRTIKFIPPPWYKAGGGWSSILKRFYLYWKAFDLLNKRRYILWVVALLEACHVTNKWSPSWPPSWVLPRIENQVKTARNGNFLRFTWKITHKYFVWF